MGDDYLVTVCSNCLTSSCWHYEFVCSKYITAGTVTRRASELRALGKEHPDNFSREKLMKIEGFVREVSP